MSAGDDPRQYGYGIDHSTQEASTAPGSDPFMIAVPDGKAALVAIGRELAEARARVDAVIDAADFLTHRERCSIYGGLDCDCGLAAFVARIRAALGGE